MKLKDLEILASTFLKHIKISQDLLSPDTEEESTTETATTEVKISGPVTINVASINTAITKLNSALPKIDPNDTAARAAINKLVGYLMWFRTVGIGAESNMTGKQKPTVEEFKRIIRTNLFAEDFIISIAALLQMSYDVTPLKNEFLNLK